MKARKEKKGMIVAVSPEEFLRTQLKDLEAFLGCQPSFNSQLILRSETVVSEMISTAFNNTKIEYYEVNTVAFLLGD